MGKTSWHRGAARPPGPRRVYLFPSATGHHVSCLPPTVLCSLFNVCCLPSLVSCVCYPLCSAPCRLVPVVCSPVHRFLSGVPCLLFLAASRFLSPVSAALCFLSHVSCLPPLAPCVYSTLCHSSCLLSCFLCLRPPARLSCDRARHGANRPGMSTASFPLSTCLRPTVSRFLFNASRLPFLVSCTYIPVFAYLLYLLSPVRLS